MGNKADGFKDDPREEFEIGYGIGVAPEIFVSSQLDPVGFREKFGPPAHRTKTFNFKHPEWQFRTTDTKRENLKVAIINNIVVVAFVSEEAFGKFLAFVDRSKPKPVGG